MRQLALILLWTTIALVLTGCTSPEQREQVEGETSYDGFFDLIVVDVEHDGRTIPCVVLDNYPAGGLSCDWSPQ